MRIQVLFFAGCPNYRPAIELVRSLAPHATVEELEVRSNEDAERMRFLGSPTILVDGVDVEPSARTRTDFGFSCRTYNGMGLPGRELLASAIACADSSRIRFDDSRSLWLAASSVVVAAIASVCCWLPLALVAFGLSAAGWSIPFESARPWLFAGSAISLTTGYYLAYRGKSCCRSASKRSILWGATTVVMALAILPLYADALVGMVAEPACCVAPATETQIAQRSTPAPAGKSQPLGSEGQTAALTVLSDDAHELKDAFNAGKDAVRVVLLVSPRCPMCQAGARLVQEQALERIDSDKLKIYVVWIKRFFGDSRDAAEKSMALVPDKRARHFWDGNNQMPKHYGKSLDLPGERNFAWDVYFVFNPKAAWGETPPTPDFWMHQLGGSETGNRLDGDKFRDAIRERMPK